MEALDEMVDEAGPDRASYLLERLMEHASNLGVQPPLRWNTPYINTIPTEEELAYPGDGKMERRIKSLVRWNATAMVVRANKYDANIGGHLATYASRRRCTRWRLIISSAGLQIRAAGRAAGGFCVLPGARFAGDLCTRVSRWAAV